MLDDIFADDADIYIFIRINCSFKNKKLKNRKMRHVQGIYSKRLSKDSTDYFDIVAHTGTDSPGGNSEPAAESGIHHYCVTHVKK